MAKSTGGRGKKAEYATTHMRVPEPIKADVQRLVEQFHGSELETSINLLPGLSDALVIAKGVLTQKKSARVSMEKLLTALYHTEIKL